MNSNQQVLDFLQRLHEDIENDKIVAKHVRVLISNDDQVIGNGVLLQASPDPALITDTIYMCATALFAMRDFVLQIHADKTEMLDGFQSFIEDIERRFKNEHPGSYH